MCGEAGGSGADVLSTFFPLIPASSRRGNHVLPLFGVFLFLCRD